MDPKLEAEVLKTCESIGFADEGEKYVADTDWELCVKDLILYLRRDDEDHSIRRLLGKTQVVKRDLLPLLKHNHKDPKTWEVTLRLLSNLLHPALLLYDEEIPKNKKYLNYYYQLEGYLRSYKAAFVDNQVWTLLAEKLRELFQIEWEKRKDHQKLIIERILILIRNILHVPADPAEERRADDDTSLHDRILLIMHISGIFDILLHTASSDSSHEYSILLLEILSLMLREQTGEQLAKTQWTRNEEDKTRDERELVRIREKEAVLRSIQLQKLPSRHSRFCGTYVLKDMKAPSGNDLLCHKPITDDSDLNLDALKKRKRVASNRKPMVNTETTRRSTIPVRIILKNFCASFVNEKYNRLMSTVKDYINRSRGEDNDETYYLWGLKFFMEFNRHHEFSVKKVSDTISTHTFHYVQTLLDKYQGMMVTDKEKIQFWSKRAHTALKAYQELLFTLLWMDKQLEDEYAIEKSMSIKSSVFYLPEYRELLLGLLTNYEPVKYSKAYLKDLIETNHLFIKMIEDYSSKSRRIMIKVKGKKKKKAKKSSGKKKAPVNKNVKRAKPMSSEELEEAWAKIAGRVSSTLVEISGDGEDIDTTENVIPFDAASDVPIDEQKGTAIERIAVFLHTGKLKEAATLLRAGREVWPADADYFGEPDITTGDEAELLQSIFMEKESSAKVLEARAALENSLLTQNQPRLEHETETRVTPAPISTPQVNEEQQPQVDEEERPELDEEEQERVAVIGGQSDDENNDTEEEDDEEEEEEELRSNEVEQEFDFKGFVLKYAVARVVCNYSFLLQDWDTLKPLTLHCIFKMFHRFVFDMDYPALICQASLFLTFKKILQVADYRSDLKEAKGFILHFWPKFVKLCENKNMFVEILFWKTAREAQEIQDGYADLRSDGGKPGKKSNWTKDEDTELGLLVELYRDSPEEVKKAQKLIEFIMERWTWRSRRKRAFLNRLVERELIDNAEMTDNLTKTKKRRPKKSATPSTPTLPDDSDDEIRRNRSDSDEKDGTSSESDHEIQATGRGIVDEEVGSTASDDAVKRSKRKIIDKDLMSSEDEATGQELEKTVDADMASNASDDEVRGSRRKVVEEDLASSEDEATGQELDKTVDTDLASTVSVDDAKRKRKKIVEDLLSSDDESIGTRKGIVDGDDEDSIVSDSVKRNRRRIVDEDSASSEDESVGHASRIGLEDVTSTASNDEFKENTKGIVDDDVTSTVSDTSTVVRKVTKRKRKILEDSDDESEHLSDSNQRLKKLDGSMNKTIGVIDSDIESD